jgi:hypothetical protein
MVRRRIALILAVFMAALPFAGRAQTADAPKPTGPTFTPYGFILTNAFFNSRPFAADDYPQYALTVPGALNDRSILLSSRYNRIGVRIGGPEAMGAKLAAVLEMDFGFGFVIPAGQNVAQTVQETNFDFYKPIARMRLGYATATWALSDESKVTLLLGQDYGLVNPLFAVTLAYIGTPLFQNAGNLYTRSPGAQLKVDFGKTTGGTLQLAVLNPMDQNVTATTLQNQETPTESSGNKSRIPQLEARVAARAKTDVVQTEVGISGQYHKERYALGRFSPASVTVPATLPPGGLIPVNAVTATFTPNGFYKDVDALLGGVDAVFKFPFVEIRGEGFIGNNADNYFAHLGQGGVNGVTAPVTATATIPGGSLNLTNVTVKRTKGFWAQGIITPVEYLQLTGGYGVELPFRRDVTPAAGQRTRNSVASAGIIAAASKNLKFSLEGAYTYTNTLSAANLNSKDVKANGYQTALSAQYTF